MFFRFFFSRKTLKINPNNIKIEKKSQMSPKYLAPKSRGVSVSENEPFFGLGYISCFVECEKFYNLEA